MLGGDLNLSRLYDTVKGTTHHTVFLDASRRSVSSTAYRSSTRESSRQTVAGVAPHQNDYVFVSEDLQPAVAGCDVAASCEVVAGKCLSDHCPMRLILLEPPQTPC